MENRASGLSVEAWLQAAGQRGLVPCLSADDSHARFAPAPRLGRAGADPDLRPAPFGAGTITLAGIADAGLLAATDDLL